MGGIFDANKDLVKIYILHLEDLLELKHYEKPTRLCYLKGAANPYYLPKLEAKIEYQRCSLLRVSCL